MRLWRNIIIIAAAVAVLGAGYWFAVKYEPAKEEAPESVPKEVIDIYKTDAASITAVTIEQNGGKLTFEKNGDTWKCAENPIAELIQERLSSLCSNVSYITAKDIIAENAPDLEIYGLNAPSRVTVTGADGTAAYLIGEKTPTGTSRYFMLEGNSRVYTVSDYSCTAMLKELKDFRDMTVVSLDAAAIKSVTVQNGSEVLAVSYIPVPEDVDNSYGTISAWGITSPLTQSASNDKISEKLLTPVSSISAENIVADEKKPEYGFGAASVKITTDEGETSLDIGIANGVYYVSVAGKTPVYVVPKTSLAFLEVKAADIMETFINIVNIAKISKIEITDGGTTSVLSVENETNYYIDGVYASEDGFKSMYQAVIGLTADGIVAKDVDTQNSLMTITYYLTDGTVTVVNFYDYDAINVAAEKDGVISLFMKKTKLNDFRESLARFKQDPQSKITEN